MKTQIENLKQELREFLELSKTITHGKWRVFKCVGYFDCPGIEAGDTSVVVLGSKAEDSSGVRTGINDATFIARSRNISPATAECLLGQIEWLEQYAVPVESANQQLQQIITIWEAAK